MLSRNKISLIIPLLILAVSCTKVIHRGSLQDPVCEPQPDSAGCAYQETAAGLVSISGPAVAGTGQTVQLTVVATGRNGCANSAVIHGITTGFGVNLTANVHYNGCMCTEALVDIGSTYSFTPAQPGIYTFQGLTYEGTPVTYTLTVQ